jgi:hypothetical protein
VTNGNFERSEESVGSWELAWDRSLRVEPIWSTAEIWFMWEKKSC